MPGKANGIKCQSTNLTKEVEMGDSLPNGSGGSITPPPDTEAKTSIRTVRVPQIQALPEGVPPCPTALETEDYYGLWRNKPRLLARSNYPEDQWSGLCNDWSYVEDSHPFRRLWSDPEGIIQKELAGALEYTKWNSFEAFRIGSAQQASQVKLLIIVEAESTTWSHAWVVARICRDILRGYNITDVEVEVQDEWLANMERIDRETSINDGATVFPSEFPDFSELLDQPDFSGLDFASFQSPFNKGVDPQLLHPVSGFGDSPEVNSISLYVPTETLAPTTSNVQAEAGPNTITTLPPKAGKRLSLNSVRILNKWLSNHVNHPYPSVRDVEASERQTGLTRQQILNWFANARRRKKFNPPETTDISSAEASPRDIPLRRPPTPIVQQSPLERWENSPPEDEPSTMAAIARAVSGASDSLGQPHNMRTRNGRAPSSTGTWAPTDTSDSSRSSKASGYSHTSNRSLNRVIKKRRRGGPRTRNDEKRGLSVVCHRFQCTFCTETFKLKHTWSRHEKTQHLSLEQWECSPLGPTALNEDSETACVYCGFGDPDESHFEEHHHDLCHKHLIDYERNSPLPFSTQQGAPYSSTSAFELLQLELDYFYSNYTDINHCISSDESLHLEACCIIFGAEMNYQHPSTAKSWLRDLVMSTPDVVNKARMTPMKSAARSRFSELKIHSKKNIFEDCKLEVSLRQYIDMLQLLNLEIEDVELQKEACSIINHMPDVSPMFSQLLIGLVFKSTGWLASFRERVGLPPSEVASSNAQEGLVPPLLSSGGLPVISNNDLEHWGPPSGPNSPPMHLGQKIVSLNDGNMYRGLTRDLTRYVARTMSPLNPISHIPTDEELQYQARWIMYDSHDVWYQTPADNLDWLTEFKRDSGFF
ncbi:Homeobox 4 [Fusarium agapanthi]|uniref:Homeobox 4 n=1 Tax=Fusarium agapanthi TaxID=1803897 RepID=A0A9P5B3V4_9HYPO|nr:Homeobox 4 [Fusarium agapanthi]